MMAASKACESASRRIRAIRKRSRCWQRACDASASSPKDREKRFADISGKVAQTAPTVKDAINIAARAVARGDMILVTGSFALAGEAKRLLDEKTRGSK